jgi:hypothetical protein
VSIFVSGVTIEEELVLFFWLKEMVDGGVSIVFLHCYRRRQQYFSWLKEVAGGAICIDFFEW